MKYLIRHAFIADEEKSYKGEIFVDGNRISKIFKAGEVPPALLVDECEVIDAEGCVLLPGVIDTHVHFRDSGQNLSGPMAQESLAAVAGGVTSFLDMPNTQPPTLDLPSWQAKMKTASEVSLANYGFFIGVRAGEDGNWDSLERADYARIPGIKLFMGSSTGGMLVEEETDLRRVFALAARLQVPLAVHAESERRLREQRERLAGQAEDLPVALHSQIRDEAVCTESSRLAVDLARQYGTRLHLLHVSTAAELELLENKPLENKKITAETCPHYLYFSSESYESAAGRTGLQAALKCNPALKTPHDRDALMAAFNTSLIDTLATDHAPHPMERKQGGALKAASGMPGVQFSLLLMLEKVRTGETSLENLVSKMSSVPARLYGMEGRGAVREGNFADLVLVRPCEAWTLERKDVLSPCGWSPYEGTDFHHRICLTMVNGKPVWKNGKPLSETPAGMPLEFRWK